MALPILPEEEIVPQFERLEGQVPDGNLNHWHHGWHHGLHRRTSSRCQLPLYLLIDMLHRKARLTPLNIRLVSEKKLKRVERQKYRQLQAKIFSLTMVSEVRDNFLGPVLALMDPACRAKTSRLILIVFAKFSLCVRLKNACYSKS